MAINHHKYEEISRETKVDKDRVIKELREAVKDVQRQLAQATKVTERILRKTDLR